MPYSKRGPVGQRSMFGAKRGAADSPGGLCRPPNGGRSVAATRYARTADRRSAQDDCGDGRRRVQLRLTGTFKAPARLLRKAGAACPANRWKAHRWHRSASFTLASWSTGNYTDGIGLNPFSRNRDRRPRPQQIPWRDRLAHLCRNASSDRSLFRGLASSDRGASK